MGQTLESGVQLSSETLPHHVNELWCFTLFYWFLHSHPLCILCQDGKAFLKNENSAHLYQKQYENTISIVQWGLKIAAYPICLCVICSYTSMAFRRQKKCFVTAGSLTVTSEVCGKLYFLLECMRVICLFVELLFSFQELTDKMKAFVEKYEQKTDGKIGIIEVRKLKPYAVLK